MAKVFVLEGYVERIDLQDISYTHKETGAERTFKKLECNIRCLDDSNIYRIEFLGQQVFEYFMDIEEGTAVICSFYIQTSIKQNKYIMKLRGSKIVKL